MSGKAGLASRVTDWVKAHKWPIITTAGTAAVMGTGAYLYRKNKREEENARWQRLLRQRKRQAQYGVPAGYGNYTVKHAGLLMEKNAFGFAFAKPLLGKGINLARSAMMGTGRMVGKGLRAAGRGLERFGPYAQNYLTQKGWQTLGAGVGKASQTMSSGVRSMAGVTGRGLGVANNYLVRKANMLAVPPVAAV